MQVTQASILKQIRELNAQAEALGGAEKPATSFSDALKESLDKVNELQQNSRTLASKFEAGDQGTDLVDVMIASQKSGLAFHAATEVRNKLVTAYQEIMNMPV